MIGAVAAWVALAWQREAVPAQTGQGPARQQPAQTKLTAAQTAYAKGDYQAAAKALEAEGRTDLDGRLELAVAYENAKEYDKALAIYGEIDKAGQLTAGYAFRAGEVAYAKKDKATAIRYYQLAKERYAKEGGHRITEKIQRCDDRLAELQKAGT